MKAVRRSGSSPTGRAPNSSATVSAHAPAALTTTGACHAFPAASTHQPAGVVWSVATMRDEVAIVAAAAAQAVHVALVQGMDVDLHRVRLEHRELDAVAAQQGRDPDCLGGGEQFDAGDSALVAAYSSCTATARPGRAMHRRGIGVSSGSRSKAPRLATVSARITGPP